MNSNTFLENSDYPSYPTFPNESFFIHQPTEPQQPGSIFSRFSHITAD